MVEGCEDGLALGCATEDCELSCIDGFEEGDEEEYEDGTLDG